jgi:hypothetical protein
MDNQLQIERNTVYCGFYEPPNVQKIPKNFVFCSYSPLFVTEIYTVGQKGILASYLLAPKSRYWSRWRVASSAPIRSTDRSIAEPRDKYNNKPFAKIYRMNSKPIE